MITFYKTEQGNLVTLDKMEPGCWIDVFEPTPSEKVWLSESLNIVPEFVKSAFDDEETAHIDVDDDTKQILVIVDCPFVESEDEVEDKSITQYDTHPLTFVFLPKQDYIITFSLHRNETIEAMASGKSGEINTKFQAQFFLKALLHISQRYLSCLRSINRQILKYEKKLRRSMKNAELMKMLGFEKSLIYFTTSLQGMEAIISRIQSGRTLGVHEEDQDLLDDVRIEVAQALEMCQIYTNILEGTMDTFSSIINNNLNYTIRTLTIITLIMAVPTIVFSFYGMNVEGLPLLELWWFPLIPAAIICLLAALLLKNGRLLK